MATKRKDFEAEAVEETTVPAEKPAAITHDFHREDMNELRDAVNWLLSK